MISMTWFLAYASFNLNDGENNKSPFHEGIHIEA